MRIPRFWTAVEGKESNPRGAVIALRCLGWSDASVAEARTVGLEKLSRLAERVRTGADFPGRYLYADRPILRPLVHRGGLRADILESGEIHVGDEIELVR